MSALLFICEGNSPVTPAQRDSDEENISIWWRHNVTEAGTPLFPVIVGNKIIAW